MAFGSRVRSEDQKGLVSAGVNVGGDGNGIKLQGAVHRWRARRVFGTTGPKLPCARTSPPLETLVQTIYTSSTTHNNPQCLP
jgi:hypothetical protein